MESDKVTIRNHVHPTAMGPCASIRVKRSRVHKIDFPLGVRIDFVWEGDVQGPPRFYITDTRTFFAVSRWRWRMRWARLLDRVLGEPKS